MILLSGSVGESSDGLDGGDSSSDTDSDVDANRPVSPCNFTFIGANTATGKSSLRSKPKAKKVRKQSTVLPHNVFLNRHYFT